MTREFAVAVMIAAALLILGLMLFAWRRRLRRDAGLRAPLGVPEHAEVSARYEVLYAATTRHDQALERVTVHPLAYRARGELAVTDRGIALSLDGSPTVFLASTRLISADRATVALNRVVEPDGLIRIVWQVAESTAVDSYVRLVAGDPAEIVTEIQRLCAAPEMGASS